MADRPNILFVFSDQQRWDTLGCYGQSLPVSPNLDRIAAEGVRFERAFTCQPVCGPARACIQTGTWATETGCFRNGIALPLSAKTMAHYLGDLGYQTGYVGKWHLASTHGIPGREVDHRTKPVPPAYRGGYRDYWVAADVLEFTSHGYDGHLFDADMRRREFKGYRVDACTDIALEFLRRRSPARPWFLFISYIEPHHQNDRNRYEGPEGSRERWKDYEVPGDLKDTQGDWRENYPDYLGCCNSLDANVGRLVDQLRRLRMSENTLLIYTSDHGSHFRTRNNEYKRSCHDGCIRIPMILRGPGFTGGQVSPELVSLLDTTSTVLAAAGHPLPAGVRGRPLQDALAATPETRRAEVFLQISESQVGRAIRTDRWKYSVSAPDKSGGADPGSERYVEDFLYDLEADPHERNNLVADPAYADVRSELRTRLIQRIVEAGEPAPTIEPAKE
jgi:uncharacterized sulfatase